MKRLGRLLRPRTTLLFAVLAFLVGGVSAASAETVTIASSVEGIAGANGWYLGSSGGKYVVVHWSVSGPVTASTGCEPAIKVYGPTTGKRLTCTVETSDGGTVSAMTKLIKIDADPPTGLGASASRPPDANGWYNHPVSVAWQGADATSGIAACTTATYAGPDNGAAAVGGGCTDNAGNSAATTFGLRYDATPPSVTAVAVESKAGQDVVEWKSSGGAEAAVVARAERGGREERVVFTGSAQRFVDKTIRDGVEYRYSVRTYDQAANASQPVSVLAVPKVVVLGKPAAYTPRAAAQPVLRWARVPRAAYYHVQLFRRGRRILAAWPRQQQLRLRTSWIWQGRRYRLTPGRYRWYAWAGFGARAAARYKLLGRDDFIATRGG